MNHQKLFLFSSFLALSGCGFNGLQNSVKIATQIEEKAECKDIEPFFWHTLHDASLNEMNPHSWESLKDAMSSRKGLQGERFVQVIEVLQKYLGEDFWFKTREEQIEIWAQIELKLEDRPNWAEMQQELSRLFALQTSSKSVVCQSEDIESQVVKGPSEHGARFVMATAYQSCEASVMAPMTSETRKADGIKVTGRHPSGGGNIRVISSLSQVQATHPYLRIQNKETGCFNVEAKPLIYDYGGKPGYASSGGREMDLFKNFGSGSKELGIDCSGLVLASFGVQGLRLIPNQDMVAGNASGFGSSSLLNPPKEWKCVDRISVGTNQTLNAGDVITIKGHTVLVDEVGNDPWGLRFVANKEACAKITENQFDFTIIQSSPSKGGVGINRYIIKDYLKESSSMRKALIKYAQTHCQNSFDRKTSKPVWSETSIIRHKATPECLGRKLSLKSEGCVSSCTDIIRP